MFMLHLYLDDVIGNNLEISFRHWSVIGVFVLLHNDVM